jgi:ribosomal protein S7
MRPRNTQLTEKYKSFRQRYDSLYDSRLIQTFFNKFTKKGKKALARKHIARALAGFRSSFRRPKLFYALLRIFQRLRIQFLLVQRRQGRTFLNVPMPVRRNKRDILNIQALYKAICGRRERKLEERIQLELLALTFEPNQAPIMRAQSAHLAQVYVERVYMDRR